MKSSTDTTMRSLFIELSKVILLTSCIYLTAVVVSGALTLEPPFDKLDLRHLSQLRFEVRNIKKPTQCSLFWKGVNERLAEQNKETKPEFKSIPDEKDLDRFAALSRALKNLPAYRKMADFIDDCLVDLRKLQETSGREGETISVKPVEEKREEFIFHSADEHRTKLTDYEEKLSKYKKQLEQVTKEKEAAYDEIKRLESKLERQVIHNDQSKNDEQTSAREEQLLLEKEAALKTVEELNHALSVKTKEINTPETSANSQLEELKEKLVELQETLDETREERDEILEKTNPLSRGLAECGITVDALNSQIDKLKYELTMKQSVVEKLQQYEDSALNPLNGRMRTIDKELNEKQSKIYQLEAYVRKKDGELKKCQERCKAIDTSVPVNVVNTGNPNQQYYDGYRTRSGYY